MISFFHRYRDALTLLALLVLCLSLLLGNLRQKSEVNVAEQAVMTVFAPFQDASGWLFYQITGLADRYLFLVDVKDENIRLQKELNGLYFENNRLLENLGLYKRIDNLLTFPNPGGYPFEVVRVISRDTTNRVKIITVNKGSDHGLAEEMPVITHLGMVGRIVRVSPSVSKVLLINDVRSAIDCIVQKTRDPLVLEGANSPNLKASYLAVDSKVSNGDVVISSGLGGIFPKGLVVGRLENIFEAPDQLFLTATVKPAADIRRAEEVIILKINNNTAGAEQ